MMKNLLIFTLMVISFYEVVGQCAPIQDNVLILDHWDDDSLYPLSRPDAVFSDCWGYVAPDGTEYGIIGSRDSIFIFDISIPTSIEKVVTIYPGDTSRWRDFKVYNQYLYSITDQGRQTDKGITVYDLSNLPFSVTEVDEVNGEFGQCHNIYIDEPNARLYAVGISGLVNEPDICIYSLTNPANPSLLNCYDLDTIAPGSSNGLYIHDVFVRDNIAYCGHGYSGYYIWDFSDLNNVLVLGSLDNSFFDFGYVHSSWNADDNNHAVVATEVGGDPKLYWVNQTNPSLMSIDDSFKDPICSDPSNLNQKVPHNPYIKGDTIYVSHYHDGVQVLKIDNSTNTLSRIGYYDTYPENTDYSDGYRGSWGVFPYFPSGTIIASDRRNGFFTLKYKQFEEYVFQGPGTDWNTPTNWSNNQVPPPGFDGKVFIESDCVRTVMPGSEFLQNALITIRNNATFTQH